ncbi:ArsA family ATPase [Demetria terragena]|uniref:ArsA family ATPase n=1 Tax=Demetria terragena TaxID=63959 RepID=UPI000382D380|nr:ArsA family ATPase [Demetria terragena]
MLLGDVAGRQVLFVGGKGGVGKTSVASGIALARAREGARVLVVSTDPAHNLGHLWDRTIGDTIAQLAAPDGVVDGLEVDPERTVERHLAAVRRTMDRLLPERLHRQAARHLELARSAPGTHESAVLDRIAEVVEDLAGAYDLIVFDTAPTGSTVRLLALPDQLGAWTDALLSNRDRADRFGAALRGLGGEDDRPPAKDELRAVLEARRRRFVGLREQITDPTRTSFVIVLLAERMPIAESVELHRSLAALGVDIGALVANRRSPLDAGSLLAGQSLLEAEHLVSLRRQLPDVPLFELPLVPGLSSGEAGVSAIADTLASAI